MPKSWHTRSEESDELRDLLKSVMFQVNVSQGALAKVALVTLLSSSLPPSLPQSPPPVLSPSLPVSTLTPSLLLHAFLIPSFPLLYCHHSSLRCSLRCSTQICHRACCLTGSTIRWEKKCSYPSTTAHSSGCRPWGSFPSYMSCYVVLCYVMLCYVMLCHVMSCHVMSCHVVPCHVMSW